MTLIAHSNRRHRRSYDHSLERAQRTHRRGSSAGSSLAPRVSAAGAVPALNRRLATLLMAAVLLTLTIVLSWPLRSVAAGDEGVYGAAAPAGSAFVRVFNATAEPLAEARIADHSFGEVNSDTASDFVFLAPGAHSLTAAGSTQPLTLQAGRYYTVVRTPGGFTVLNNARHENRLKALVLFYNFTDGQNTASGASTAAGSGLSLKTPDGKAAVVDGVPASNFGFREVNAINASLAVFEGGKKIADAKPVGLERGRAYSLFATGPRTAPVLSWVVN